MMFPATVVQAKVIFHELGAVLPWADIQEKQLRGLGGNAHVSAHPTRVPRSIHHFILFLFSAKTELESTMEKETWEFMCSSAFKMLTVGSGSWSAHTRYWSQVQHRETSWSPKP